MINIKKSPIQKFAGMLTSFIAVFVVLFAFVSPANAGLGVSPSTIIVEDLMPETEVTRQLFFSRAEPTKEQILSITVEGPAAESVSTPSQLVLPVGQKNVPLPITINTGTLAAGTYEVSITGMETIVEGQANSGASKSIVKLGAKAKVQFSVTNEVVQDFSIK